MHTPNTEQYLESPMGSAAIEEELSLDSRAREEFSSEKARLPFKEKLEAVLMTRPNDASQGTTLSAAKSVYFASNGDGNFTNVDDIQFEIPTDPSQGHMLSIRRGEHAHLFNVFVKFPTDGITFEAGSLTAPFLSL